MSRESEAFNNKTRRAQRKLARRRLATERPAYELHVLLGGLCGFCSGPCLLPDNDQEIKRVVTQWGRGGSISDAWNNSDQETNSDSPTPSRA